MCEEEAVRYLRDLCGEKEALERAQEKQLIATKLVAQGIEYNENISFSVKKLSVSFFSSISLGGAHSSFHHMCFFNRYTTTSQYMLGERGVKGSWRSVSKFTDLNFVCSHGLVNIAF
jgi:hypothetical protein